MSPESLHAIFNIVDREQGYLAPCQVVTLEMLFWSTRYLEKSDPLDGVYALLGMLTEQPPPFTADYNISLASLLTQVSRYWLVQRNGLDMFTLIIHRDDDLGRSNAPTWTYRADWSSAYAVDPSNLSNVVRGLNCLSLPTRLSDQQLGSDVLILQGLVLDYVTGVSVAIDDLRFGRLDTGEHEFAGVERRCTAAAGRARNNHHVRYCGGRPCSRRG